MTNDLTLIAFGAILGLITGVLGRVIYESISRDYKKQAILDGIINEFKGLNYQCIMTTYLVYSKYGLMDKQKLNWFYEYLSEYKEIEQIDSVLIRLESILELPDNQVTKLNIIKKLELEQQNTAQGFKKYKLLFVEQILHHLDLFDVKFQYQIIDIVKKVDRLNQEIDYAIFYFRKTFEIEDEDNLKAINSNYDQSAQGIGRWSCQLSKKIMEFIQMHEKSNFHFPQNTNNK